jgi:hypothetical protein
MLTYLRNYWMRELSYELTGESGALSGLRLVPIVERKGKF